MKLDLIYLAGAMEDSSDMGQAWRIHYQKELWEHLKIDSIIPLLAEGIMYQPGENILHLKKNNPARYQLILRRFCALDLHLIDMSDAVVVRWEGERITGTVAEVHHCYMTGKPVFLVTSKPYHEIPGWFVAQVGEGNVYSTLPCLMGRLMEMKYGK